MFGARTMRSAGLLRRGLRISPRTAVAVVAGSAGLVGFAAAEPAKALDDSLIKAASAVGIAAIAYTGYSAMSGGPPDYSECPPYNSAFVFLKPHAATEPAKALVKAGLEEKGYKILAEGELTGSVIDSKQLIDNHYYAIAAKAALTKPKDLNPPEPKQAEFAEKFGLSWSDALGQGKVFNAVDACEQLNLDGVQLDGVWAKAKAAKQLVKFGGGFYCGLVDPEA